MSRTQAMLDRLPPAYRVAPGSLVHGLLDLAANELAAADEDRLRVQRTHWIDTALDREDLARLGALLDLAPEPWEPDDLFRVRLKALVRARLDGGVAVGPIAGFVAEMLAGVRRLLGLDLCPGQRLRGGVDVDAAPAGWTRPALEENPRQSAWFLGDDNGAVRVFDEVSVQVRGLDAVAPTLVLAGRKGGGARVPIVLHLGTGQALGFLGEVPAGARLKLACDEDGVRAHLDGRDVSGRVFSLDPARRGESLRREDLHQPARPLRLDPGVHRLRLLNAGIYDLPAWDAVTFALARDERDNARFDRSSMDEDVFFQEPVASLAAFWTAATPAAFDVHVPIGLVLATPPLLPGREEAVGRLPLVLQRGVDALRGAGIRGRVRVRPLTSVQPLGSRGGPDRPVEVRDRAGTGRTDPPDFGALLDITPLDRTRLE